MPLLSRLFLVSLLSVVSLVGVLVWVCLLGVCGVGRGEWVEWSVWVYVGQ